MCLILFSYQPQSSTPLILGANRDEFFNRPSLAANYWEDAPQVIAGRDCVANGTWLGVTTSGRFAAVTNVREPHFTGKPLRSRGDLTREFLTGGQSAEHYLDALKPKADDYAGFNLLVGDFGSNKNELYWFSNRGDGIQILDSGVYGLSNHLLNSPWPKVEDGKQQLADTINRTPEDLHQTIRKVLEKPEQATDDRLPKTGVSYDREKALSSAFITLGDYGTRASTVLTIVNSSVKFSEQQYAPSHDGSVNIAGEPSVFAFALPELPAESLG